MINIGNYQQHGMAWRSGAMARSSGIVSGINQMAAYWRRAALCHVIFFCQPTILCMPVLLSTYVHCVVY